MFLKSLFAIAAVSFALVGCGKKKAEEVSSADATALGKVMGPSTSQAKTGSTAGMNTKTRGLALQLQAAAVERVGTLDDASTLCDLFSTAFEGNSEFTGTTCTQKSCSIAGSTVNIDMTCAFAKNIKYTCGTEVNTFSDMNFTLSVVGSTSYAIQSYVNTTIAGTSLNGPLKCGVDRTVSPNDRTSEITEADIVCTYNGKVVPTATVKASMDKGLADGCTEEQITPTTN